MFVEIAGFEIASTKQLRKINQGNQVSVCDRRRLARLATVHFDPFRGRLA